MTKIRCRNSNCDYCEYGYCSREEIEVNFDGVCITERVQISIFKKKDKSDKDKPWRWG